jgi:putative ABC transport system permease protein
VGDTVTLRIITSSRGEELSWNALDVEIKGIYATGNPTADSRFVIMPLELVQEGLSLGSDVTEITLRLGYDPKDDIAIGKIKRQIKDVIESRAGDLEVYSWKELSGTFLAINQSKKERQSLVILLMLLAASMGIINTMLMAVLERTREIGMLTAMGMKPWEIKRLFLYEGGIIGIFGSILGCILGGLGGWYLEVYGLSIASWGNAGMKFMSSLFPLKDVLYGDLSFGLLLFVFILGTAISVIAAFYPAAKAAKLDPIEALKTI